MKLNKLLLAGATAVACSGAIAEDITVNGIDLSSGTAFFGAMHFSNGPFTDTFNFVNGLALADISASLSTAAIAPGVKDINFATASLNGNPFTLSPTGIFEFGTLIQAGVAGPYQIIVTGITSGVGAGGAASYSGTLNAVPEPETYVMMLAGLAAVGFVAARRKRNG